MEFNVPNKDTGYLPTVFSLLKSLDDEHVYGHEHMLSHPADIFILTFRDAIECINRLAKVVNETTESVKFGNKIKDDHLTEIRRQVFDLLFYTGNFVEGCQSIIKCLFKKGDKNLTKAARTFKENVEDYTKHASQLINKVKHQHRRPRTFTFTRDDNDDIIIGYYLEGLVKKNTLGPDPELHKTYKNNLTGFSLNRAIPYHLYNLYYVSACLEKIIKTHGRLGTISNIEINDNYFRETFLEVEKIPCMLLPDEMKKKLPVVTRKNDENYLLQFPGKKKIINKENHVATIRLEARVGIRDRIIALPYFLQSE